MPRLTIFIDDGGVLNDNAARGPQWQRLLGEFFPPLLGGEPEAWAEANRVIAPQLWHEFPQIVPTHEDTDAAAWWRVYQVEWMRRMGAAMGIALPNDDACFDLAERAAAYVTPRVRSAFPGAAEAVRMLHTQGYALYTASGERSFELEGYLSGMGIRNLFRGLYGPDLINTLKVGPAYYHRLFADAGVDPADALVVDDSPLALGWAQSVGARAVLVGPPNAAWPDSAWCVNNLVDVPTLLSRSL